MNRIICLLLLSCVIGSLSAQKKDFNYKFYGFVRGDLYYDSRDNQTVLNELFHLFPKDVNLDPNGKDLNANPSTGFYSFSTRLGLDINGPSIWNAATSAKVEADFCGYSKSYTLLRIRQAYVNFEWERSALLLGQTWHPLFGKVSPNMLSLSTGSPFQPFNRSPMLRYQYGNGKFKATGAAIFQLIGLSTGPDGKSMDYMRDGLFPEVFAGVDYTHNNFLVGAGAALISITPRTESEWNDKTYKVDERLTTATYMAQAKYTGRNFTLAAKTLYNQNGAHMLLLGGYGVSAENELDGTREYTPFKVSSSWISATVGKKYQGQAFLGYSKNLGTTKPLLDVENNMYGSGLNIDQLINANLGFVYTLPCWRIGLEYGCSTAYYGDQNSETGRVDNTHAVTNHRLLSTFCYYF